MNHLKYEQLSAPLKNQLKSLDDVIARQDNGLTEVIWFFIQIDRIGHLSQEPWVMRNLFPPSQFSLTALVPSTNLTKWACADISPYFTNFRVLTINDSEMIPAVGILTSSTVVEFERRLYVFSISAPLMNELVEHRKLGNALTYEQSSIQQENRFREFIGANNLEKFDKFVVYHCREGGYLPSQYSYHSYRDACPRNAELAISYLIDSGYAVIRIGDASMTPLNLKMKGLVDLPFSQQIRDISTFELVACCDIYFGTTSGPLSIAQMFKKTSFLHNSVCIGFLVMDNTLILPKSCFDVRTRSFLTYEEIVFRGIGDYSETERFNNAALIAVENSPVQLELLTQDGIVLYESNFELPISDSPQSMPWKSFAFNESRAGALYGPAESVNLYLSRAFI